MPHVAESSLDGSRTTVPLAGAGLLCLTTVAPSGGPSWDALQEFADQIREVHEEPFPNRSVWEMKLFVVPSALASADEIACWSAPETSADVMLAQLMEQVERRHDLNDLSTTLARLALARTDLDGVVVGEFVSGLEPLKRGIIERCLFDWNAGRGELHQLVRHQVSLTRPTPRRRQCAMAVVSERTRSWVHDRLKNEYQRTDGTALRNGLESLHHELLGTPTHLRDTDVRLLFPEQLDEIKARHAVSCPSRTQAGV